ncbi:hypothetical protein GMO_02120 [Gluconobacter morbifer G707]|uniref:Uncharacterized protein n=2 Tax=Gluconobacter TaxID=441 RepID=G6XFE7_9PROT|nr:hypothetical protein GMO_02120 [Gluconobacter morbifer G707]
MGIVILAALLVGLMLWMRSPAPVTPAENHTKNVAPQAMLWGGDVRTLVLAA